MGRAFFLSQSLDDEAKDRHADAGIGNVKGGPGMGKGHVQIEEEEVDDVAVQETIGQVAEDAREEKGEGGVAPPVWCVMADEEGQHDDERDARKDDEEDVVVLEGAEGGAVVGDEDEREKFRDDEARLIRRDVMDDEPLRDLVEQVKRKGKEKKEAHLS